MDDAQYLRQLATCVESGDALPVSPNRLREIATKHEVALEALHKLNRVLQVTQDPVVLAVIM